MKYFLLSLLVLSFSTAFAQPIQVGQSVVSASISNFNMSDLELKSASGGNMQVKA